MAVNTYSKANGQSNTRRGVRYERIVDGNGRRFIRTRNGGDVDHWSQSPRTSARAATPSDGPSSLLGRDASPTLTAPTHGRRFVTRDKPGPKGIPQNRERDSRRSSQLSDLRAYA